MKKISIFVTVTLGMLTAFGPFITDFYLPFMPEMASCFATSPSAVATSLTAGMIGLAVGQVLIGPLSDKYGRKKLLVGAMVLFSVVSLLILFSPNIVVFNALRLVRGLAGAGGLVLSKSIATDMYEGKQLADFLALMGAVNGIAPVCAPIIGGALSGITDWKGVPVGILRVGS